MNLALKWLDNKPLTKEDFESYKIVSLWDMLRFHSEKFVDICMKLTRISRSIEALKEQGHVDEALSPAPAAFYQDLEWLHSTLSEMSLPMSHIGAKRLLDFINSDGEKKLSKLQLAIDKLTERITDELQSQFLMSIPANRIQFYDTDGEFLGGRVLQHFPDLAEDASEAGNCFAFGRYTACVFHLMRIMENVVQQFATKLEATQKDGTVLDVKNEEWLRIEQAIGRAIEPRPKGEEKEKCAATLAALSAVRAGWRNPTMHPKATYTEDEAGALITAVKLFVKEFSELPELARSTE